MIFGYILAGVSVFFWGITFVCTKSLLSDFSALEILFYRFVAAYLGLWILCPKIKKINKKDNLLFAAAGLSGVVLYQFSENIAINFTTASNVSVIVSICPLFTAIVAQIFLHEKHITPYFIAGFILAIFGVSLVSLNGQKSFSLNPKGDLLALFAAICWGFYSLFVSLINKKSYNPLCSTRRIFFFAVLFMIPLMIFGKFYTNTNLLSEQTGFAQSVSVIFDRSVNAARFSKLINWVNLLFLGIIASAFCFSAWNKACNLVGTVKISSLLYLIPVVTIIFAHFVLQEKITVMGITGTFFTIVGLFLSEKQSGKKKSLKKV